MERNARFLTLVAALLLVPAAAAGPNPPAEPARVSVSVEPATVAAGSTARITVRLDPIDGVKINRYPNAKLMVPARNGLTGEARAQIGPSEAPAPGSTPGYFTEVEPLTLDLRLDPAARTGKHEIGARVSYFYCMPANGFCAPVTVPVKIPLTVR